MRPLIVVDAPRRFSLEVDHWENGRPMMRSFYSVAPDGTVRVGRYEYPSPEEMARLTRIAYSLPL